MQRHLLINHFYNFFMSIKFFMVIRDFLDKEGDQAKLKLFLLLLVFTHVINSHVFQRKQKEAFA